MGNPVSAADSFFGLDLQKADPLLGAYIDCSGGPITPEIIDAAAEAIRKDFGRPPCGMKGNPHLVHPRPAGKITFCIQCGYMAVLMKNGKYRNLNKKERDEMDEAFKSFFTKNRRLKRKGRKL